jgi:hypothetical protein
VLQTKKRILLQVKADACPFPFAVALISVVLFNTCSNTGI